MEAILAVMNTTWAEKNSGLYGIYVAYMYMYMYVCMGVWVYIYVCIYIWLSYIHSHLITTSQVYLVPSWNPVRA